MLPACVSTCPAGRPIFGDLKDKESLLYKMMKAHKVKVLKAVKEAGEIAAKMNCKGFYTARARSRSPTGCGQAIPAGYLSLPTSQHRSLEFFTYCRKNGGDVMAEKMRKVYREETS